MKTILLSNAAESGEVIRNPSKMEEKMEKIIIKASFIFLLTLSLVSIPGINAWADKKPIKLTLVSGWITPIRGNVMLKEYIKRVNERGEGKVFIDYKGGPEIAPQTESPALVRDGVYDMVHSTPGFYAGLCPEALTVFFTPSDPVLLRKIGFTDMINEIHRKRMGCTYLGSLWRGENFVTYLKKPMKTADFSGLKTHAVTHSVLGLKYLGAVSVSVKSAELYVALQRGVIDAAPLPMGFLAVDKKLNEVCKYILHPPIPITTNASLLINAKRWDSLPSDVKQLMMDTMIEMEPEVFKYFTGLMYSGEKTLVEQKGMEIVKLPPKEAKKLIYAYTEYPWQKFQKDMPEYGPKLYSIVKPYLTK